MAAQNETRTAGNAEIRPEHLVLGLLAEPDGLADQVLADAGHHAGGAAAAAATAALPPPVDETARADPVRRRGQEGAAS